MGLLDRIGTGTTGQTLPGTPMNVPRESEPENNGDLSMMMQEEAGPKQDHTVRRFQLGQDKKRDPFRHIRERVQTHLLRESNRYLRLDDREAVQAQIVSMLDEALVQEGIQPARVDYMRILDSISNEVLGFGPIQPLLDDETCTEVMVNGFDQVFVERFGKLYLTEVTFDDEEHVMRVIDKIVAPLGRRVDEASPMVDARLPDGSRVNAIIPPLSLVGPVLTIRRFPRQPLTVDDLVRLGSLTKDMADFLAAAVQARLNILVSGGTGSGKTTLLNVLSSFIPETERIVTIEDAAELQLVQRHVITLESRSANIDGRGEVAIRDLVRNTLRMRPDRIIVGEVRSGEALDMLQAMNTGHDGSLTTVHANSPRESLSRLETMVLMAGMDLPVRAIRDQIGKAINLIVQQERLKDGTRKIVHISEVQGLEGDTITLEDLFKFDQTAFESGKVYGTFRATGARPKCYDQFQAVGVNLPLSVFGKVLLNG
ncbi:MAG TPA: CpaF family protein [Chloroflexota bacterium]|nr:CpaF family protein [Chloroflexota bacterium]